jgi:hypothetical protein
MKTPSDFIELFDQSSIDQAAELDKLKSLKQYRDTIYQLVAWTASDIGQNQYLPQCYREAPSGRLYSFYHANLQNAPKPIRHALLDGQYDYDIENCHFSLLSQLAKRCGYETNAIDYYLSHKTQVRESLTSAIGFTDITPVKESLLAMIYGAKKSTYWKAAIPKYLGQERAELFYTLPIVKSIFQDIEIATTLIIEHQPVNQRGNIKNAMGKNIHISCEPPKIMAHLLQGIEARILQIARKMFAGKISLLQHDGFTCYEKIDRKALEVAIKKELGYDVKYSEERLKAPEVFPPENKLKPNR